MKFGLVSPNFVLFSSILTLVGCVALVLDTEWNHRSLTLLLYLISVLFIFEYAVRVYISWKRGGLVQVRLYILSFWGIVDLLTAATSITFLFGVFFQGVWIRYVRLLRLVWILNLVQVTRADNLIIGAFLRVRQELGLTLLICGVLIIFSATLMYLVEGSIQPDEFGSIPRALWWAVATLTTVGYGDVFPVTALGRLIAAFLAILGIAVVALPAGLIGAAVTDVIREKQTQNK